MTQAVMQAARHRRAARLHRRPVGGRRDGGHRRGGLPGDFCRGRRALRPAARRREQPARGVDGHEKRRVAGMPAGRHLGAAGKRAAAADSVPTIVFHGDQDRTVHPRNGEQVIAAGARQCGARRPPAGGAGRVGAGAALHALYPPCRAGRAVAEHWLVHGAGHAWSGGRPRARTPMPAGPTPRARCCASSSNNGADSGVAENHATTPRKAARCRALSGTDPN